MKILIGSAWPYANGSLHIGHIAALLPADLLARYYRAKGDDVFFVSGSDCHGTPVVIRAKQENKSPQEISNFYHEEFCECFSKLGFSYDGYTKTSDEQHKKFVENFHKVMYDGDYVFEGISLQAFCDQCHLFLADRFVIGKCPSCGENARGDQCDTCGNVVEPENLLSPKCSICDETPIFKETKHLFVAVSRLENELRSFVDAHPKWRKNAIAFSNRYIEEGLRDRAVTRDLDWGIDVPKAGYEDKKVYIWAENVLGYLSASKVVCDQRGESFEELWGENAKHYYVHGKDNIPFHTIILPSLLFANGGKWHLPDEIISSEYLTLEGRKISTSQNYAIWIKDIVDQYNPDSLRYFLIANGPEKRDTDFSWREYVNSHNGELLGAYGNFVNRNLAFIYKYFDGVIPEGKLEEEIKQQIYSLYDTVGIKIEQGNFKEALDELFGFIRNSNKYFDVEKPWETRHTDITACYSTLYNCVQIISNLAILLYPFIPFSSAQIGIWLNITNEWKPQFVKSGFIITEPQILFERIDKKVVEEEVSKLSQ